MDFKRSAPYSGSDELVISWIIGNYSDQAQLSRNRVENEHRKCNTAVTFRGTFRCLETHGELCRDQVIVVARTGGFLLKAILKL